MPPNWPVSHAILCLDLINDFLRHKKTMVSPDI